MAQAQQLEMRLATWGGRRAGAGRKPTGRAGVRHGRRDAPQGRFPAHVTLKMKRHVWNLRRGRCFGVVSTALQRGCDRFGTRVVEFSVQGDHIHLIVEAEDARAMRRAIGGIEVRIARGLNRAMGAAGPVFADRYHSRLLRTPREVRNALHYVLNNARKHQRRISWRWIDPFSSGAWFDGWIDRNPRPGSPLPRARTWLLARGWRRRGLLETGSVPAGP